MPHSSTADRSRAPLTRQIVLAAAMRLADEQGIGALSMRRLGTALGVEAMSLYNHVVSKEDLLAGCLDLVVGRFDLAAQETAWKAGTRRTARSAREVLSEHRWAAPLMLTTLRPGPARLAYMEAMLGRFRGAGFSVEMAHHGLHVVDGHVLGYAVQQASFPLSAEEAAPLAEAFLTQLDAEAYPSLAEHIRYHIEVSGLSDEADFEFGLDLILDGLERLAGHARRAPEPGDAAGVPGSKPDAFVWAATTRVPREGG
jgi:AcrR family transcriptional regulator